MSRSARPPAETSAPTPASGGPAEGDPAEEGALRIDKFLWFARLTKTRAEAQRLAESRRLRIDGRVIHRASALVRLGAVIAFTRNDRVSIVRVAALPSRRGPAAVAATCYCDLSEH